MIRILNAEPLRYSEHARGVLQSFAQIEESSPDRRVLIDRIGDFDVLMVRLAVQVDRELMDAGKRLKAIVTSTTGLDHIDLEHAGRRGIAVLSLNGEQTFLQQVTATGEHTFGLLLAVVRRIPDAMESVRRGEWNRDDYIGRELSGKRLGIVGLGRLGGRVAAYGQAFGMDVLAFDPYRSDWPEGVERCLTLNDLLVQTEVLSLHVPLNDETTGLIGRRELALLPRGATLINTARGGVLDAAALVELLESGQLSGAALDVVDHEREDQRRNTDDLLRYARSHSNLLITPHIGGATVESMAKTELFMAEKLKSFVERLCCESGKAV